MVLIPLVAGVSGETALKAGQQHSGLFFDTIVHDVASFQSDFDEQRGEGFELCATFARFGRRDTVKLLKGLGKAVRTVVPVSKGDIDDLFLAGSQPRPGDGQSTVPNVFPQRVSAQDAENTLEMERGRKALFGDTIVIEIVVDVSFDIVQCILDAGDPVHGFPSCQGAW